MLGEMERGWAWTSALLGVNSNNIHLCGDERALHLVSKLVSQVGGTLE
jgi:ATP-dependent RNA helicase SUPV3L1/SUV3